MGEVRRSRSRSPRNLDHLMGVLDESFDEAALADGFLYYVLHEIETKGSFIPGETLKASDPFNGRAAYEQIFAEREIFRLKSQAPAPVR